ncbi:MAG: hypothetical protein CFE24_11935 [Flavobacterium sp. BFFFF2]|nr:MAG: hypothetical protein CFE24_11935 [Flavobacterium sp. BFFFF2]
MYLSDISSFINRKDKRSIRNWCAKNHLQVYKDSSGEFVMKAEFELTYNMPLIKNLKQKHGDDWMIYYEAYNKGELHKILDMNPKPINNQPRYIPKGKLSANLFNRSTN